MCVVIYPDISCQSGCIQSPFQSLRRVVKDIKVDYCGFNIPDAFVVGYGLDYNQRYRNLPYIGVVEFEEENS